MSTFADALRHHADRITALAKMHDERGYMVLISRLYDHDKPGSYMFPFMIGGCTRLAEQWGPPHRQRVIYFSISPDKVVGSQDDPFAGTPSGQIEMPTLKRYLPITAALELVGKELPKGWARADGVTAGISYHTFTTYVQFYAIGKDAIRIILATLNMPHHRDILRGV